MDPTAKQKRHALHITKWIEGAPSCLLDVGIGPGTEVDYLTTRFPEMRVVGLEPMKRLFDKICAAWERNGQVEGRVLLDRAAWSEERTLSLHSPDYNPDAGSVLMLDPSGLADGHEVLSEKIESVRAIRLDTLEALIAEVFGWGSFLGDRILLWMDIEGAELEALRGAEGILPRVQWVNLECRHKPIRDGACTFNEVNAFLTEEGFTRVNDYAFHHRDKPHTHWDSIWVR